jgi:2,4-dienoyl-CoA reductase-like NADH-dependent reductase (Old Yellow Enzyme family)
MSELFDEFTINNLQIENRFVRSATTSYWSKPDGTLRDIIIAHYKELAQGNIGLIIKGHSFVHPSGKAHEGQSGLSNENHLPKMEELVNTVHFSDSKIIAQLNHGGYAVNEDRVTASEYSTAKWTARKASIEEIEQIISYFASSAELAVQAGFDGVQIHAAHGYLVSQFLSDHVNKRQDKYGGSLKNRSRILFEIYDAIRKKIGTNVACGIKLNCDDFAAKKGVKIEDAITLGKELVSKGIDFIELSGGGPKQERAVRKARGRAKKNAPYYEATFAGHAERFRKAIPNIPLALVDGIRTKKAMDGLLAENVVDLISMSKPFIIEPNLVNELQRGQEESKCIDCGKCVSQENFAKRMLRCYYLHPLKDG